MHLSNKHVGAMEALYREFKNDTKDTDYDHMVNLAPLDASASLVHPIGAGYDFIGTQHWPPAPEQTYFRFKPGEGAEIPYTSRPQAYSYPDPFSSMSDHVDASWVPLANRDKGLTDSSSLLAPHFQSDCSPDNGETQLEQPLTAGQPEGCPSSAAQDTLPVKPEPTKTKKSSSQYAAKMAREREKAEKLKEKNKRAQRKFRQRQKDRQESAERQAAGLSQQLEELRMEKQAVEFQNRQLKWSLRMASQPKREGSGATDADNVPTFTPADGWLGMDPQGGIVFDVVRKVKMTHRQLLELSMRDVGKILHEYILQLEVNLKNLDNDPDSKQDIQQIEAVISERRAFLAYLAINKRMAYYQILCCKFTDPPIENCKAPAMDFWKACLDSIELSKEQVDNILKIRTDFLRSVDKLLQQRDVLRTQLMNMRLYVDPSEVPSLPNHHLTWATTVDQIRENHELLDRANAYFMVRMLSDDAFTNRQLARLLVKAWPWQINCFAISRALITRLGLPDHMQTMLAERMRTKHQEHAGSPMELMLAAFQNYESSHSAIPSAPSLQSGLTLGPPFESEAASWDEGLNE